MALENKLNITDSAELAVKQDVTEQLKAADQMKWVGMMNNIKARAEEIVYSTIVYKRET